MKAGTLVTLSRYGKDRDQNRNVWGYTDNPMGMITKIRRFSKYPFVVKWVNIPHQSEYEDRYSRRELKYAGR